jgi:N-methylhydantoinase B
VFAPWGLAGGASGRPARFIYDPDGESRNLPSKCTITVPKGKTLRIETPGGGGFGNPNTRPRAALAIDIRDGKVTDTWLKPAAASLPA